MNFEAAAYPCLTRLRPNLDKLHQQAAAQGRQWLRCRRRRKSEYAGCSGHGRGHCRKFPAIDALLIAPSGSVHRLSGIGTDRCVREIECHHPVLQFASLLPSALCWVSRRHAVWPVPHDFLGRHHLRRRAYSHRCRRRQGAHCQRHRQDPLLPWCIHPGDWSR